MLLPLPGKLASLLPPPVKSVLHSVRQHIWRLRPPAHLFLFDGRVPHWLGFGRGLYASESVFRASVQECERQLLALGGESILANFEQEPDAHFLEDERRLLQLVVVIQISLVDLWRSYGVQPDGVIGFSTGEVAAVYTAGGLSLTDALRVSLSNALISQVVPATYGLLQVAAGREHATMLCAACPVGLFIMLELNTDRCLLLCDLPDVAAARRYLKGQGISSYLLKTPPLRPYHTPVITPHKAVLRVPLAPICPLPLARPCYLATLAQPLPVGSVLPADYWLMPHQQPVWQYTTMRTALHAGYQIVTPIGIIPYPYHMERSQTLPAVRALPSFLPGVPEQEAFATMRRELAQLGLVRKA